MEKARCKYSLERLKQMASERGAINMIEEIDPAAIEDPTIKRLWERVYASIDQIEELLTA